MNIYFLADMRNWAERPDPEVILSVVQARLRFSVGMQARSMDGRWADRLPADSDAFVFLLITAAPASNWVERLRVWLNGPDGRGRRLYVTYTDSIPYTVIREITSLTKDQPLARSPYRIVQQSAAGLEHAARWMAEVIEDNLSEYYTERGGRQRETPTQRYDAYQPAHDEYALDGVGTRHVPPLSPLPQAPHPVRVTPTRWRNLPSNQGDLNAYPDQFTLSLRGTEDYQIAAASHRGKTHAHQGTFREDAVAAVATRYWNILAVADGAGSAPLARIGSNLAVREAVAAMRKAMPNPPSPDDVARAIWEGIDAAHDAVEDFARARNLPVSDLHTTLQLVIHAPQRRGCLIGVVHVGDGIIVAEDVVGTYYNLTEPDTDPEDSGRTLFLTSAKVNVWKRRTIVYDFEQPIRLLAMMTDGLSGDLEASGEAFSTQLFEPLRQRVLCYPLRDRERALLEFISYERRGSFDDRTLLVLSLGD